jgi:hypothetical protein
MESKKTRIIESLLSEFRSNVFRYTDVIRTAYELSNGIGRYTSENRGYYSSAMGEGGSSRGYWRFSVPTGHLRKPGRETRFIDKNEDGSYSVVF